MNPLRIWRSDAVLSMEYCSGGRKLATEILLSSFGSWELGGEGQSEPVRDQMRVAEKGKE